MAWTVLESLLGLVLIWSDLFLPAAYREEELSLSMLWLFCGFVPAAWLLFMGASPGWSLASRIGLAAAGIATALLIVASWIGGMIWGSGDGGRVAQSAWVLTLVGVGLVTALAGFGLTPPRHWRWLGVAASLIAGLMALIHVWHGEGGYEVLFTGIAITAAVVGLSNIVLGMPLHDHHRWLSRATAAVGIATGATFVAGVWMRKSGLPDDLMARLAGAGGIVATCGLLATAVVSRLTRRVISSTPATGFRAVVVLCPACARKAALPVGAAAACAGCGLGIRIELTDPTCAECGYPLRGIPGGRCPECGTLVGGTSTQST
jgi:hypothetical protein